MIMHHLFADKTFGVDFSFITTTQSIMFFHANFSNFIIPSNTAELFVNYPYGHFFLNNFSWVEFSHFLDLCLAIVPNRIVAQLSYAMWSSSFIFSLKLYAPSSAFYMEWGNTGQLVFQVHFVQAAVWTHWRTSPTKFTTASLKLHKLCELNICSSSVTLPKYETNVTLNFISCAEDLEFCEFIKIPCQSILGLITLHMYLQYMCLQTNFGQDLVFLWYYFEVRIEFSSSI